MLVTGFKLRRSLSLLVILCLIMFSTFYFISAQEKVKDTKRLIDIKQIAKALIFFEINFGRFPKNFEEEAKWEVSYGENNFIQSLIDGQVIESVPVDPINSENYFYRYQRFPAGSYGCQKSFIILQVINFEGIHEDFGMGQCPERDFAKELPNGYTIQIFE